MRYSRAVAATGTVRTNAFGVRHAVIAIAACAGLRWAGVAFAQEAYVSHRLGQQVADLRKQNAQLAAQNAGYRKDVQAIQSGTAYEEEARQNGFAKPNERVFLVAPAPTPSPTPAHSPSPSASPRAR